MKEEKGREREKERCPQINCFEVNVPLSKIIKNAGCTEIPLQDIYFTPHVHFGIDTGVPIV